MALKRRRSEIAKEEASEYAKILHQRISEEKTKHDEAKKRRQSSMRK